MMRPWYRSRILLFGAIGMFLIGVGWWNSYHYWNSFAVHGKIASAYCGFGMKAEGGFVRIWAGRPYQGLFLRNWTGFRAYQSPSGELNGPRLSGGKGRTLFIDWEANDRPAIQCHFWILSLVYSGAVATALIWRQRGKRNSLTTSLNLAQHAV